MSKKNILLLIAAVAAVAIFAFIVVKSTKPKGCEILQQQQQNQINFDNGKEVNTSDWKVYRNEEYGFEVDYPEGWFVTTENNQYTKEHFFRFLNYQTPLEKANVPDDALAFYVMIYPKNNSEVFRDFKESEMEYKNVSNERIEYDIGNGQKIKLYIISKRTVYRNNISWDVVLPYAKAFLEDNDYGYMFYHASPLPSGIIGQKKAIDILKQSLKSFNFH